MFWEKKKQMCNNQKQVAQKQFRICGISYIYWQYDLKSG